MPDSTLKKDLWRIVAVISVLSVVSVAVVLILTEDALGEERSNILEQKMNTAAALAGRFQLRFEDATKVLKIAAESTEFETVNNLDSVSEDYKGIPIGLEEGKRKILRDLHENYANFDTVHFMLPNGDIYVLEPYERQLILPRLNFADREYYQGAIATGKPYASDVIISTASLHRVAPIAVPVYDPDDGSLNGLIVGATDLGRVEEQLEKELNLANNNRVVYVDSKGNVIEDVGGAESQTFTTIKPLVHLQSVQQVINGKSGYLVEDIDGVETLIVYNPAIIGDRQWGVLFMQPTADAYSSINYLRGQAYVMLAIIVSIIGTAGYFLISFRMNSTLSKQLARANAELVEKDKVKDEFLKIASHELRTPIQPILGYSSLGERGLIKGNEAWKVVHKEARRLMKLANNIVDISMAQSGILTYDMQKTNIGEVVQSAVEYFKPIAQEKKISLELTFDEKYEKIEIDADATRLKTVFDELLDNAFKFTEKGHVRVECVTEPERILIRFIDSGTSIPPELLPNLFGLFSSKSGSDAKTQGAGLGLFICKTIINAHGGTITAKNRVDDKDTDGSGAVFEVTLPLYSLKEYAPETRVALS